MEVEVSTLDHTYVSVRDLAEFEDPLSKSGLWRR